VVLVVALAVAVGAAVVVSWRQHGAEALVLLAVPATGVVLYVFAGLRLGLDQDLPPRYELVPAWCIVWAILASAETLVARWGQRRPSWADATVWIMATLGVMLLVSWSFHWAPDAYRTTGPTWRTALAAAEARCAADSAPPVDVEIMPAGGDPPTWTVRLRCDRLG